MLLIQKALIVISMIYLVTNSSKYLNRTIKFEITSLTD